MKRQWEPEELIEHFTLVESERILLANKTGASRLGFAVLLKCFSLEARFPAKKQEISKSVVSYIATQVEVPPPQWRQYKWTGRTIEYHRALAPCLFWISRSHSRGFPSLE
jgi:hypothetical protein